MSAREFVILGTSSQRPTRTRNHNGYLLRMGRELMLFDPGEGTQRQFTFAGRSSSKVSHIFLTHLHGDHCLGLPGMLQRMTLENVEREIPIHFPESGLAHVERLIDASIGERVPVRLNPIDDAGGTFDVGDLRVTALPLDHRVPTLGWRIEEPDRKHLIPARLAARGVTGPDAGRLLEEGSIVVDGQTVKLEEVSEVRRGHAAAVVMDTGVCDNAVRLADGVDALLCEATYLDSESHLARDYAHLTARQAATIAKAAGAGLLVLTHFSSRYRDASDHLSEATEVFPNVIAADDLSVIPFP